MTENNISELTSINNPMINSSSQNKSVNKKIRLSPLFNNVKDLNLSICIFLALTSSFLMIMSFPNTGWYILAFIGMVPIIFIIETQSKWKILLCNFIYLLVLYYYLLDWIEVFHPYALPGLVGYVIFIHYIPLFIYKFFRSWNKIGSLYNAFLFATIMVIFEYCRELGFARFPYGNIAYTQYRFLSLIQISDITGYLGISYFIYFVNAAIAGSLAKFLSQRSPKTDSFFPTLLPLLFNRFALIAIIFILLLLYGNNQIKSGLSKDSNKNYSSTIVNTNQATKATNTSIQKKIRVSLIQHWFDYNLSWTPENKQLLLDKIFRVTEEAIKDNPDLIIWPESALNDYYEYRLKNPLLVRNSMALEYFNFFRRVGKNYPNTQYLVGSLSLGEVNYETIVEKKSQTAKDVKTGSLAGKIKKYNSALLINNEGKVIDKSAKMLLVPVGEYFPYSTILKTIPWFASILEEAQASQFTPFEKYKLLNYEKGLFSTLVCYEDAFEFFPRTLALHGAAFFVLITNDAWSYSIKSQELHFMFSVFRAIENRRHVLRAGNAGVTGTIDPYGKRHGILPMFEEGYSTIEFTPNSEELSLFTRYGNFFIISIIVIFVLLIHYSLIIKLWRIYLWIKKKVNLLLNK